MYKIKIGLLLLVGFLSHVLKAESKELDLLDIFQNQEELIEEGQKQFLELLKFNAENERRGCPEDNIYVFSLVSSDDWSQYVKVPNTPAEEYLGDTKDELNQRLKAFNTNPDFSDFGMYLCLVTELSAKVSYDFPPGSLANIKAMYERNEKEIPGFSSAESAASIEKLEEQWDNIIKQVFDGTEQQLQNDSNFVSFQPKPNRMYVTQTLVKAQLQDPEEQGREVKKVINSARIRGYFKQHWDEIYKYEKRMLKTRSGEHYKLENRILSAIEYVEGGMDSNPAPSMNFKLEGQTKIKDAANQAGNNTYTSSDLANQNLFLFDFTGIYGTNSQVAVDAINTVLSGQLAKSSTKLKVFITDSAVSQTTIDMIKNINILDPAYENSLILWLNIDNDAVIETSIRVSPDLQNEINAHLDWERFNQLLQDGSYVDMALFTAKQILDIKIKVIYGISEFVRTVLQAGIIPPKYYDMTDMNQYNPILKDIMTYVNPAMAFSAVVMQPLLDEFGGMYPVLLGANITDIQFALFCGFWNGILLELDGIFEVISMVGYFVDERKKAEVDQVIDVFQKTDFLDLVEKMLNGAITAHTGHPTFVAHQIGKDIIMILTIAIPVSKVGTVGKLAKVTKVINAVDKLNPLTHVFDAAGFILKKGTGKVIKVMKDGVNGTKLAELTKGRLRVFQQHLYTGAQSFIQLTEAIPVPQVVLDTGNGLIEAASIVMVKVSDPGGTSSYFRRLADDAGLAATKNLLKGNFDFAKLFKNAEEADLIAGKIASLPSSSKLYDVANFSGLKAAIDALPDDLKRKFFEDLADIGESAGNAAGSIWFGRHLDDLASNPDLVIAWKAAKKQASLRTSITSLEKIDVVIKSGNIPVNKLEEALDSHLGDILENASDLNRTSILNRLNLPHVDGSHFQEMVNRLQKWDKLTEDLINHPEWFDTFDDILNEPGKYWDIVDEAELPNSAELLAWGQGHWWKNLRKLAQDFESGAALTKFTGSSPDLNLNLTGFVEQVTLEVNGIKIRVDFIGKDAAGKFHLGDAKFSTKSKDWVADWLDASTDNQKLVYPLFEPPGGVNSIVVKASDPDKLTQLQQILGLSNNSPIAFSNTSFRILGSEANQQAVKTVVTLKN